MIRGVSKCRDFLLANASCNTKACLIWPFSRNPSGYAGFTVLGVRHYAHRYMCELVNGPPPTPKHEAAHSCGQGHMGCVHPNHLSWKSVAENVQDSWDHTPTPRNPHGPRGRLTPEYVDQIRQLKGTKTQAAIARQFGVSASTVRDIYLGRSHGRRKRKALTDHEIIEIRNRSGATHERIANEYGISVITVSRIRAGRTYKYVQAGEDWRTQHF